jgi:hypothetical protein
VHAKPSTAQPSPAQPARAEETPGGAARSTEDDGVVAAAAIPSSHLDATGMGMGMDIYGWTDGVKWSEAEQAELGHFPTTTPTE